jgi:hypothetical protein
MIKPRHYMLPEDRFPVRFRRVVRVAREVLTVLGRFKQLGGGRLFVAVLEHYRILYFSPLSQPKQWVGVDWADPYVRRNLHGLSISYGNRSCLMVFWTEDQKWIRFFRDPSKDAWDKSLRRDWARIKPRPMWSGSYLGRQLIHTPKAAGL